MRRKQKKKPDKKTAPDITFHELLKELEAFGKKLEAFHRKVKKISLVNPAP